MTTQSRFYELSMKVGHALGAAKLGPEDWHCSTGAELSVLLRTAEHLGLYKAAAIIEPLVRERCLSNGDIIPDPPAKENTHG